MRLQSGTRANRRYNIDYSTPVGDPWEVCGSDGITRRERLYLKRTGEYYIMVEMVTGNGYEGRPEPVPLTFEEARSWASAHVGADEYDRRFGPIVKEPGDKDTFSLCFDRWAIEALTRQCMMLGVNRSQYVQDLVVASLDGVDVVDAGEGGEL